MKPYKVQALLMSGWSDLIRYADLDESVEACNKVVAKGRVSARVIEDENDNVVYEKFFNSDEYESEPHEWEQILF